MLTERTLWLGSTTATIGILLVMMLQTHSRTAGTLAIAFDPLNGHVVYDTSGNFGGAQVSAASTAAHPGKASMAPAGRALPTSRPTRSSSTPTTGSGSASAPISV